MSAPLGGEHAEPGEYAKLLINPMNGYWAAGKISWIFAYVEHCTELPTSLHELLDTSLHELLEEPVPLIVVRHDDERAVQPAMVEVQQPLGSTCEHHAGKIVVLED